MQTNIESPTNKALLGIDRARALGGVRGRLLVPAHDEKNQPKFVEMAVYERGVFTPVLDGERTKEAGSAVYSPQLQRLASIIFEGKVQLTNDQFVAVPENVTQLFAKLPIAGNGSLDTPTVGQVASFLSTDPTKAIDANWEVANQKLSASGVLSIPTEPVAPQKLLLGAQNATTGHRTAQVVETGLQAIYKDKVVPNVGLPLSAPFWIDANVGARCSPCWSRSASEIS